MQATATGFDAAYAWNFDSTLEGWALFGATSGIAGGVVRITSTGTDPIFESPAGLAVSGALNTVIRARVKRIAGSGWDGIAFYSTSGHGSSSSFYKGVADTTVLNEWRVIEWDMAALTVGGTDWTSNTVTQIRLDLGSTSSDVFDVDWVTVGRVAPVSYSAAIAEESSVRADETGHLAALYTVRVQLTQAGRTVVGGFGISGVSGGTAGSEIEFGVRADRFYVGAPSGATGVADILPFVIQTSDATVNGVLIPKGVYMDAAYIKNLSALVARLGTAWIDNAMIADLSAAKITAGNLTAGSYIRSTTYSAGVSGFSINANGTAEFNSVTVRGAVYASSGSFAGSLSAATGTFAGSLSAATGTFAGALSAATGTFSGDISAASGTFTGTLQSGTTPAVSGSTMTGTGAKFTSAGPGCWGNSTTNISFDGTVMTLNGAIVTAANLNLAAMSVSLSPSSIDSYAYGAGDYAHGTSTATATGGTGPYSYAWSIVNSFMDPSGTTGTAFITGTSGTYGQTAGLGSTGQSDNSTLAATARCVATDANGRSASVDLLLNVIRGTPP